MLSVCFLSNSPTVSHQTVGGIEIGLQTVEILVTLVVQEAIENVLRESLDDVRVGGGFRVVHEVFESSSSVLVDVETRVVVSHLSSPFLSVPNIGYFLNGVHSHCSVSSVVVI